MYRFLGDTLYKMVVLQLLCASALLGARAREIARRAKAFWQNFWRGSVGYKIDRKFRPGYVLCMRTSSIWTQAMQSEVLSWSQSRKQPKLTEFLQLLPPRVQLEICHNFLVCEPIFKLLFSNESYWLWRHAILMKCYAPLGDFWDFSTVWGRSYLARRDTSCYKALQKLSVRLVPGSRPL